MLKRYWFVLYPEDRFGQGNIGVTANSKSEAVALIIDSFAKFNLTEQIVNVTDNTESIENIDIRLLDQNHVRPNMGVVVWIWKGVW